MFNETNVAVRSPRANREQSTCADVARPSDKSERTIERWARRGLRGRGVLPAVETVHGLRFDQDEVERFLAPRPAESTEAATAQFEDAVERLVRVAQLDEAIARVVAAAPPLTPEQRERLAAILGRAS